MAFQGLPLTRIEMPKVKVVQAVAFFAVTSLEIVLPSFDSADAFNTAVTGAGAALPPNPCCADQCKFWCG